MISTILSLPEELIIEIMAKGDYRMLLACQRVIDHRRLFLDSLLIRNTAGLPYT
jgi:hypothetical protein